MVAEDKVGVGWNDGLRKRAVVTIVGRNVRLAQAATVHVYAAVFDPDAVANTVRNLTQTDQGERSIDVDQLAEALAMHPPEGSSERPIVHDLVGVGIALLATMLLGH